MQLDDLTEEWDNRLTPIREWDPRTPAQDHWSKHGYYITNDVIPDEKLHAYEQEWWAYNGADLDVPLEECSYPHSWKRPGGWPHATPYMQHPALRAVVCDGGLAALLEELIGEPMGVHLNLTGWVSTRRNWHRDQYLNESYVGGFYAAVWIALDTVREDAGPFEYVPNSHKGKPISQAKVREALEEDGVGPDWPTHSERLLTPIFENEIRESRLRKQRFLGNRGDVLVWHGRLLHRGTVPTNVDAPRRALIAHFSGINHRPDMPPAVKHESGGWFFPIAGRTPSSYKTEAVNLK